MQKCLLQENQQAQHSGFLSHCAEKPRTKSTDQWHRLREQPRVNDLGVGWELILNLGTGLAARCHPAWSPSLGSTVVFAQLPVPETRYPWEILTVPLGRSPLCGEDPCAIEGQSCAMLRDSHAERFLWALSLLCCAMEGRAIHCREVPMLRGSFEL